MTIIKLNNMTNKKENRKMVSLRFKPSHIAKWKKKASKYNLTLTEYLERKADTNNDTHLFI